MARSKTDELIIVALGQRRSVVALKIEKLQADPNILATSQAELTEIEAALKNIDPTIPTLAEEAAAEQSRLEEELKVDSPQEEKA